MKPEEKDDWLYLRSKMINEGFHYCFVHYSDFDEIKDEKFHQLRKQYIINSKELEEYIINKSIEEVDFD